MTAGYSGTPLATKLGIKSGTSIVAIAAPPNYRRLLAPLSGDVRFGTRASKTTDIVHLFAIRAASLEDRLRATLAKVRPDAAVWVSWPKKAAKVPTDITEQTIRDIALPMGLVDIKVCAIDDTWSGLKLVVRKERRGL
jgi:hypothetical protein